MRRTGWRFGQAAGLMVVLLFLAVAFTPLPNLLARRLMIPSRIEAAEAIVVLGGGIVDTRQVILAAMSLKHAAASWGAT